MVIGEWDEFFKAPPSFPPQILPFACPTFFAGLGFLGREEKDG
jgi:hypothetical protein